jgi:hypothetical protein
MMLLSIIFRCFLYYFVYRVVRNFIDYFSDRKNPAKTSPKKMHTMQTGPVIEAEYRVLSKKD